MEPWKIGLIILVGVLVIWAIYNILIFWKKNKKLKELHNSGRIIEREKNFWDDATINELTGATYDIIKEKMGKLDLTDTNIKITEQDKRFSFAGKNFEAFLKLENDEENKNVWKFEVNKYDQKYGVPSDKDEINVLLTAIEKMFLSIDYSTKVETIAIKHKTTTHL